MALPAWPGALPYRPERQGWSQTDDLAPATTEMQFGLARLRATSPTRVTEQTVSFFLTIDLVDDFNTFINTTTARATSRFTMSVWNGVEYVTRNVQIVNGAKGINRQSQGTGQRVSFTIRIESL